MNPLMAEIGRVELRWYGLAIPSGWAQQVLEGFEARGDDAPEVVKSGGEREGSYS